MTNEVSPTSEDPRTWGTAGGIIPLSGRTADNWAHEGDAFIAFLYFVRQLRACIQRMANSATERLLKVMVSETSAKSRRKSTGAFIASRLSNATCHSATARVSVESILRRSSAVMAGAGGLRIASKSSV